MPVGFLLNHRAAGLTTRASQLGRAGRARNLLLSGWICFVCLPRSRIWGTELVWLQSLHTPTVGVNWAHS